MNILGLNPSFLIIVPMIIVGIGAYVQSHRRITRDLRKLKPYEEFAEEWDPKLEQADKAKTSQEIKKASVIRHEHRVEMRNCLLGHTKADLTDDELKENALLVESPYQRLHQRLLFRKQKHELDLFEERILLITAMVKEDNLDQTMPHFVSLVKVSRDSELSHISVALLKTMAQALLICGIGGTLWGIHSEINILNNMSALAEALTPSLLAVLGTIFLAGLRAFYIGTLENYIMILDDISMAHLYPALQPQSLIDAYIDHIDRNAFYHLGFGEYFHARSQRSGAAAIVQSFKQITDDFTTFGKAAETVAQNMIHSVNKSEEVFKHFTPFIKSVDANLKIQGHSLASLTDFTKAIASNLQRVLYTIKAQESNLFKLDHILEKVTKMLTEHATENDLRSYTRICNEFKKESAKVFELKKFTEQILAQSKKITEQLEKAAEQQAPLQPLIQNILQQALARTRGFSLLKERLGYLHQCMLILPQSASNLEAQLQPWEQLLSWAASQRDYKQNMISTIADFFTPVSTESEVIYKRHKRPFLSKELLIIISVIGMVLLILIISLSN